MNKQTIAAVIVFAAALLWARQAFAASANANTKNVNRDSRANVSPVSGKAHAGQPQIERPTARLLLRLGIPVSSRIQNASSRFAFNNPTSARAAFTAPLRTDYTPSSRIQVY